MSISFCCSNYRAVVVHVNRSLFCAVKIVTIRWWVIVSLVAYLIDVSNFG